MDARAPVDLGIDCGTSGCRAMVLATDDTIVASARAALPSPQHPRPGSCEQDPQQWWQALCTVLRELRPAWRRYRPRALAIDATSSTLVLTTLSGEPAAPARMYNDRRASAAAARIDTVAPADSPARGPTSSLAKLLDLHLHAGISGESLALHQADWLAGMLCGDFRHSDWNNALKLGYDPQTLRWPDWVRDLLPAGIHLPGVHAPGTPIGVLRAELARELELPEDLRIVAGTTDSTAAVLASGATRPGEAVTSLGSTLVTKILSPQPICDSTHGVYSHRHGDLWLAGGASNSGGAVLQRFFSDAELATLSTRIDPEHDSGLDYYPLLEPGERFPCNDPLLAPRLEPRPARPEQFLHGLLEGIARIEAAAYERLVELGAPAPTRILTLGAGAANPVWTRMRARLLGCEVSAAVRQEAAFGAALLARQ